MLPLEGGNQRLVRIEQVPRRQLAHRIIVVVLLLPVAQGQRDGTSREVIVPPGGAPTFVQGEDAVKRIASYVRVSLRWEK
jgi:hypothetical protein